MNASHQEGSAKARYVRWESLPTEPPISYEGIHRFEREYLRDSLVGPCIDVIAFFTTNKGFDPVLDVGSDVETVDRNNEDAVKAYLEQPEHKKAITYVNKINAQVGLDDVLRTAVIDLKIFGHAAFEISADAQSNPEDLIQKYPPDIVPNIDENFKLQGYDYKNQSKFYTPEKMLYFVQRPRRRDILGRGDIERIIDVVTARRTLLTEALPEANRVLWAGVVLLFVDTSNLPTDVNPEQVMDDIQKQIKPGKWLLLNQKVTADIVDLNPDLQKLIAEKESLDEEIIGNFQVPRFLVGRTKDYNRATAYSIMESFVNGPVTDCQRLLRRALEAQWYPRLIRKALGLASNEPAPIRIKHQWKPISVQDYVDLAGIVAQLYSSGVTTREKSYEMLGFDPKELEKEDPRSFEIPMQVVLKREPYKKPEKLTVE